MPCARRGCSSYFLSAAACTGLSGASRHSACGLGCSPRPLSALPRGSGGWDGACLTRVSLLTPAQVPNMRPLHGGDPERTVLQEGARRTCRRPFLTRVGVWAAEMPGISPVSLAESW